MGKNCSVVILAAGNSERMGFPKLLLELTNNVSFLQNIVNHYKTYGCRQIVLVLNPDGHKSLNEKPNTYAVIMDVVINSYPEKGRFSSIKLGLSQIKDDVPVFLHNIDNPFVSLEILNNLNMKCGEFDFAYPQFEGKGGHPVIITSSIKNDIITESSDSLRLDAYLKKYKGYGLPVKDDRVLLNINNISDYSSMLKQYQSFL